MIFNSVILT